MKIEQKIWTQAKGWSPTLAGGLGETAQLVLMFGGKAALASPKAMEEIRRAYPKAILAGCSTAGEIFGAQVADDTLVLTALRLEHGRVQAAQVDIAECGDSASAGERLVQALPPEGLAHVFVISDGLKVNGSDLARGMLKRLPAGVSVTGGLAADGARFEQTLVCLDGAPKSGLIAAIGFYGDRLKVGYGSLGGWSPFGPQRLVTRSKGNVLYELDGKPALNLYKQYLGEHAKGLPSTGLLFPLNVKITEGAQGFVRTILAVNEADQSMTFAGDVMEGAHAQLMKANFDELIGGAEGAARSCLDAAAGGKAPELTILVSCVGRKLVLKQRTEEELEAVRDVVGKASFMTGFYSYGELSPSAPRADTELHNQTMTITTFAENERA